VRLRLIPEERAFYGLFRGDIAACKAGVDALAAMLHDYKQPKEKARHIHELENEGDRITREIFALLNRSFITPFEREDIITLGSIIDDVLDAVDEVATMLVLYGITQPTVYLLEASALLVRAVDSLVAAVNLLESMQGITPLANEVHRLEEEGDGLYHNAIAELFLPETYAPIDVLKWNRLYDLMEQAIDRCEDVANVLQNVVLKNA
jgi:predicted phosphate transport protein (TIGR00153 family)